MHDDSSDRKSASTAINKRFYTVYTVDPRLCYQILVCIIDGAR